MKIDERSSCGEKSYNVLNGNATLPMLSALTGVTLESIVLSFCFEAISICSSIYAMCMLMSCSTIALAF